MVRRAAVGAVLRAGGCFGGSRVPWRSVEATLDKARVEIEVNVKWTGGADGRIEVDASSGTAKLVFDREAAVPAPLP